MAVMSQKQLALRDMASLQDRVGYNREPFLLAGRNEVNSYDHLCFIVTKAERPFLALGHCKARNPGG